ncbi:MAG: hypothetical protein QF541_10615 [Lentisphaeria bacterium]|jgi:hypothetical protein|nr:hypothetical protein [Lentisphaeria bacterium]
MTAQLNPTLDATTILTHEFFEARCLILELGAALDRVERGTDNKAALHDSRHKQLLESIRLLLESGTDRAENIQNLFSL